MSNNSSLLEFTILSFILLLHLDLSISELNQRPTFNAVTMSRNNDLHDLRPLIYYNARDPITLCYRLLLLADGDQSGRDNYLLQDFRFMHQDSVNIYLHY